MTKNPGAPGLAEGYEYDAYGKVSPWGYPYYDFDRDGENLCGFRW